jgi:hypothetical protein
MSFILSEDQALKQVLQGITVTDEKNATRSVQVWFAMPDIEVRTQSFPFITVELLDTNWASYRQMSGEIVDSDLQGTREPHSNQSYVYYTPVAWDLVYQITSYARHPRHDRAIMAYLLNRVFPSKRGALPIYDDLGTHVGSRHMMLEEFIKRDTIEEGRRLYRNVFTVTVTSESSALVDTPTPNVETVFLNTETTYIPSKLQAP